MELGPGPCALPPAGTGTGTGTGSAAGAMAAAAAGPCSEMLQVAEEAFRGGNFELAAEIYGSELAELPQPERGLCLRRADALARAGRMAEALDAYGAAARLARLRPDELRELAESFALSIRDKELRLPPPRRPRPPGRGSTWCWATSCRSGSPPRAGPGGSEPRATRCGSARSCWPPWRSTTRRWRWLLASVH